MNVANSALAQGAGGRVLDERPPSSASSPDGAFMFAAHGSVTLLTKSESEVNLSNVMGMYASKPRTNRLMVRQAQVIADWSGAKPSSTTPGSSTSPDRAAAPGDEPELGTSGGGQLKTRGTDVAPGADTVTVTVGS